MDVIVYLSPVINIIFIGICKYPHTTTSLIKNIINFIYGRRCVMLTARDARACMLVVSYSTLFVSDTVGNVLCNDALYTFCLRLYGV